jgi:hypothetical protein
MGMTGGDEHQPLPAAFPDGIFQKELRVSLGLILFQRASRYTRHPTNFGR